MSELIPQEQAQVRSAGTSGVTIIEHSAEVHVYRVPEPILDRIAETGLGRNLNLAFAAALFGAVTSLFAVWLTAELKDANQSATLTAILIGLTVLFLYFSITAVRDHKRSRQELRQVKGRQNQRHST